MGATAVPTTFTTLGSVRSCARVISAASVPMSTDCVVKRRNGGADVGGRQRRQVALHVDDDPAARLRIDSHERLEDAVGARDVVGAGHDRLAAGLLDRREDGLEIGRDHDRADARPPVPAA